MQANNFSSIEKFKCIEAKKKVQSVIIKNAFLSYSNSFVSAHLDPYYDSGAKFNVKGFFLDSSVDETIKSVPVFLFSLQRWEARETYISCFYVENCPHLFEYFNRKEETAHQDKFFFFNWFDHSSLVPRYPEHRDEISNVFYSAEGLFFDYRVFDSSRLDSFFGARFDRSNHFFRHYTSFKRGYIRRNRFYKRKFN